MSGSKLTEARQEAAADAATEVELAYGLLWMMHLDTRTRNGALAFEARRRLVEQIDHHGRARGIAAAKRMGIGR
jgi:hypothetical protein